MTCLNCGKNFESTAIKTDFCPVCQAATEQTLRREGQLISFLEGVKVGFTNVLNVSGVLSEDYKKGLERGIEIKKLVLKKACEEYGMEL